MNCNISKFHVLMQLDSQGGLSVNGHPPYHVQSWKQYMTETTKGNGIGTNVVIMGRGLYEMMQRSDNKNDEFVLDGRQNIIISSVYKQADFSRHLIFKSLLSCLCSISHIGSNYNDIFVLGGARMFNDEIFKLINYCKSITVCFLHDSFNCDIFFDMKKLTNFKTTFGKNTDKYTLKIYVPEIKHQEVSYKQLLNEIFIHGNDVSARDKSLFLINKFLNIDVEDYFPIISTKTMDYNKIIEDYLDDLKTNAFYKDDFGFRFNSLDKYDKVDTEYNMNKQIDDLTTKLNNDNFATIFLSRGNDIFWSPEFITFNLTKNFISATVCYRNVELFHIFPIHLTYVGLLLYSLGNLIGVKPKNIYFFFNKCFVYHEYIDYARRVCQMDPKPWPYLKVRNTSNHDKLKDFEKENFIVENYDSWIKFNYSTENLKKYFN